MPTIRHRFVGDQVRDTSPQSAGVPTSKETKLVTILSICFIHRKNGICDKPDAQDPSRSAVRWLYQGAQVLSNRRRSLRPIEWQSSPFSVASLIARFGSERILHEAASIRFIADNTDVPLPKLYGYFEDDAAANLPTQSTPNE